MNPVRDDAPSPSGKRDLGEGAALLAGCALLYWLTTRFDSVPAALSQNVPPEFFPRLLLAFIAALSVLLMLRPGGGKGGNGGDSGIGGAGGAGVENRKGLAAAAAAWTGCALFHFAGAVPALLFSCAALSFVLGERRRGILALYALGFPAAVYIVFALLLEVRFPEGLWN